MFATTYNYRKLTKFVSPVPDPNAWAVGTNSLLGGPGYVCISPSVPAGQSDQQLSDHLCKRVVMIALGWHTYHGSGI